MEGWTLTALGFVAGTCMTFSLVPAFNAALATLAGVAHPNKRQIAKFAHPDEVMDLDLANAVIRFALWRDPERVCEAIADVFSQLQAGLLDRRNRGCGRPAFGRAERRGPVEALSVQSERLSPFSLRAWRRALTPSRGTAVSTSADVTQLKSRLREQVPIEASGRV